MTGRSAIVRPHCILLDSEAFSALAADDRRMQPWAAFARRTDSTLHASTVTLAEATDGSARDACVAAGVTEDQLPQYTNALATLAETGMIE